MEELIKQAFLHVDIIGPHVIEGHYDLHGPDGEIILPQVWESVIEPDWFITMHMWPIPEPPPQPPTPPPPEPSPARLQLEEAPAPPPEPVPSPPIDVVVMAEPEPEYAPAPPPPPQEPMVEIITVEDPMHMHSPPRMRPSQMVIRESAPPPRRSKPQPSIPPLLMWTAGRYKGKKR